MKDGNKLNPPRFVIWSAMAAILFFIVGVISGPVFRIEWLAITCVVGVGLSLFICLSWIWGEVVASVR